MIPPLHDTNFMPYDLYLGHLELCICLNIPHAVSFVFPSAKNVCSTFLYMDILTSFLELNSGIIIFRNPMFNLQIG